MIGIVTGSQLNKNKDGDSLVLLLQVQLTDPDDIQSIEFMRGSNIETKPPKDSAIYIVEAGKAYKIAVAVDDGVLPDPTLLEGEIEHYSSVSGNRIGKHRIKVDGSHVFNDGVDFAIKYTEMEKAFNQLRDDYNDFVSKYLTHIHPFAGPSGNTSPPTPPGPKVSTANMILAKVLQVLFP